MFYGLDLINGEVRDNLQAGVLEPTISKIKSLKSALEAATSLLRIDDSIIVGKCIRHRLHIVDQKTANICMCLRDPAPERREQQDDGHGH